MSAASASVWVFAYGANMSTTAMRAKGVEVLSSRAARIHNRVRSIRVPMFAPFRGHAADLRPAPGRQVHGVLHEIRDCDLPLMDEWEGLGWLYDAEQTLVHTDAGVHPARVYVGRGDVIGGDGPCTSRYHSLLMDGALAANLPQASIDEIAAFEVLPNDLTAPRCISEDLRAPQNQPGRWFDLAGARFALPHTHRFRAYLDRCWTGSATHLTRFFLRFVSGPPPSLSADPTWFELDETQRQGLTPFLLEAERSLPFLGWSPRALQAKHGN